MQLVIESKVGKNAKSSSKCKQSLTSNDELYIYYVVVLWILATIFILFILNACSNKLENNLLFIAF